MDKKLTAEISRLITPIVEALGYELWGCELKGLGRHTMLRIYIDSDHGVTLDDCSQVSHQVSGIMDVEDIITGKYDLEVSSPGLDRLLFKEEHYERFIGEQVKINLYAPWHGKRNYVGEIKGVAENGVNILIDGNMVTLPIENIDKAKIVPKF